MNNMLYLSIIIKIIIVIILIAIIYIMNSNKIEKFMIDCSKIDATTKESLASSCNDYTNAIKDLNTLVNVFNKRHNTLQKYNSYVKRATIKDTINTALTNINNLKIAFILSIDLNSLNNIMDCIINAYKIKYITEYPTENKENLIYLYNFKVKNIKELYEINENYTEITALDDALKLYILTISKNKAFNIYKIPDQYSLDNLNTIKSSLQTNYDKMEVNKNILKNTYNTSIDKIPELLPLHDYYEISDIIRAILYCNKLHHNYLKPLELYRAAAYNEAVNSTRYTTKIKILQNKLLYYFRQLIGKSALKPAGHYFGSAIVKTITDPPNLPSTITENDRILNCMNGNYSKVTLIEELRRLHRLIIHIQEDNNLIKRMIILTQRLNNKNIEYHSIYFRVKPEIDDSAFNYWNNLTYRINQYNLELINLESHKPANKQKSDQNFNLFIGTLNDYIDFFNNLHNTIIEYNKEPDKIEFDRLIEEYDVLYDDYLNKLAEYNKCYR